MCAYTKAHEPITSWEVVHWYCRMSNLLMQLMRVQSANRSSEGRLTWRHVTLWLKEGTHIAQLQFVIIQQYVFNLFHQLLAQSLAVSVSVEFIAYVYTCVIMWHCTKLWHIVSYRWRCWKVVSICCRQKSQNSPLHYVVTLDTLQSSRNTPTFSVWLHVPNTKKPSVAVRGIVVCCWRYLV